MSYREAMLYFYTGTGNPYRVTTWLAEAATPIHYYRRYHEPEARLKDLK